MMFLGRKFAVFIALGLFLAWSGFALAADTPTEATMQATSQESGKKISINIAARELSLIDHGASIYRYPIALGKPSTPTPVGYYKILTKEINPTWIDPSDPEYTIPSGEGNPLGFRWMRFQGNYGIHGTNNPGSIGQYVSNGCIRMKEVDVEELFDQVEVGTPVEITYNRVVVAKDENHHVGYTIYPDGYGWQSVSINDVERWLSGYGVDHFVSQEEIAQKIESPDGVITPVASVYPLFINGEKIKGTTVVQNGIIYLPAIEFAEAARVDLGWKPKEKLLVSSYGEAKGYDKKGTLYFNSKDVGVLFHMTGKIVAEPIDQSGRDGLDSSQIGASVVAQSGASASDETQLAGRYYSVRKDDGREKKTSSLLQKKNGPEQKIDKDVEAVRN